MQQREIGMQIAAARKKLNYTQRELAEKLGVSDKTISKWERGAGYPDIAILLPLCKELGLEVSQLLGDTDLQQTGSEKNLKYLAEYAVLKVKENRERIQRWMWLVTTILAVLSIVICLLVNYVLEEAVTWSWITTVSIVYGWMLLTVLLLSKQYTIEKTLLTGMVMIFPYLYCLSLQLDTAYILWQLWSIAAASDGLLIIVYLLLCKCTISIWYRLALIILCSGILNVIIQLITGTTIQSIAVQFIGNLAGGTLLACAGIYQRRKVQ